MRFPNAITTFDNSSQDFDKRNEIISQNLLFDLQTDYAQEHPIEDAALAREMRAKLAAAMRRYDSPPEQFVRLGLNEL